MVFRRAFELGQSRQVRPPCRRWATVGDNGQAMRGSSVIHAPASVGNAGHVKEQVVLRPARPTSLIVRGNE
jgi:hypothetical protein